LAIFAALLLVVVSLAGVSASGFSSSQAETQLATAAVADHAATGLQSNGRARMKKNKSFKVSLFLLRKH